MKNTLLALTLILSLCACKNRSESLTSLDANSLAAPPQTINIRIKGYKPQAGNTYQNIFVSNFSVVAGAGQLQWSTPRDGMPDSLKLSTVDTYGFSIDSPESVVTGFQDLLIYTAGIDLSQQSLLYCANNNMGSIANDIFTYNDPRYTGSPLTTLGLRDCDKLYMGLNTQTFDSNNNGIPDYLEMRCGMNPLSKSEAFVSNSGDGVANIDKCKMNIPISENANSEANQLFAYQYKNIVNADGSMDFVVNNIPVLNAGQDNFIVFYVVEKNLNTNTSSLYTAFAVMKAGYVGQVLQFDYWATDSSKFTNQQILVP